MLEMDRIIRPQVINLVPVIFQACSHMKKQKMEKKILLNINAMLRPPFFWHERYEHCLLRYIFSCHYVIIFLRNNFDWELRVCFHFIFDPVL